MHYVHRTSPFGLEVYSLPMWLGDFAMCAVAGAQVVLPLVARIYRRVLTRMHLSHYTR
jgi:hypothetical protein